LTSAFEIYLRTGRRNAAVRIATEFKFNPWHDPEDGRFTFAGQGRYFPGAARARAGSESGDFRGSGGSFGGGGSSGSWDTNALPKPKPFGGGSSGGGGADGSWEARPTRPLTSAPVVRRETKPTTAQSPTLSRPDPEPRLTVRKNGYDFSIDAHARTRRVSGEIRLQPQPRSRRAQANAGIPDRRDTDDGGHFVAARFNGPREWFNHFAQDANFNRGAYRALEDQWATAVRSGKRVFVDITPHYRGTSMRPYRLVAKSIIDGKEFVSDFPNQKRGR
jgi:hypothetical protein